MSARDTLITTYTAHLPPGSPLPFSVKSARHVGKNIITADVVMFDGLPAKARLKRWALGWSTGWDEMPGGDISLDDGAWVRVEGGAS